MIPVLRIRAILSLVVFDCYWCRNQNILEKFAKSGREAGFYQFFPAWHHHSVLGAGDAATGGAGGHSTDEFCTIIPSRAARTLAGGTASRSTDEFRTIIPLRRYGCSELIRKTAARGGVRATRDSLLVRLGKNGSFETKRLAHEDRADASDERQ